MGGLITVRPGSSGTRAFALSYKYSILHKIAVRNWIPSGHRTIVREHLAHLLYQIGTDGCLNFRKYVFDTVMKHAESQVVKRSIGFPKSIVWSYSGSTKCVY